MTTCSVTNSSSISCDYGCCGTPDNRTCCEFTLSESVIIVICVVGALVVVAIVVALIVCLTSKQKNRVTRIRPRQRNNLPDNEPRVRRFEIPKPPPYSEAPPLYDALPVYEESRSTEPILPGYSRRNTRETTMQLSNRRQQSNRRQNMPRDDRHINSGQQNDPPPSYVSVINMESNNNATDRHDSPEPGTSGLGRFNAIEPAVTPVIDRTRHGSPHPSLASGRISSSMLNRPSGTLHKTASERSRRKLGIGGNNSITPVTIREITVHSNKIDNPHPRSGNRDKENERGKRNISSKIPRPSKRKSVETESPNIQDINSVPNSTGLLPGALEDSDPSQSPPPINAAAAVRRAQRHAVLHRLQQRQQLASPVPVQ